MRIRTIAAALVLAAPLVALESPQAAACWGTGWGSGYGYTAAATPVTPRRYGYTSYGYSAPAYYGGRVGYRGVGWRRGYGYGVGRVGVRRVGVGRVGRWR